MNRRVLVVFHDELLNGATIAVLRTVPLLEARGWEFAFWVPAPGPAYDRLAERGYRVDGRDRPVASGLAGLREPPGLTSRLASLGPYLRQFARFARSVQPDVVHSNSLYSFAEAVTTRALGMATVIHLHDMAPESRKRAIARTICRRGAHACFAVSESCARSYAYDDWRPEVVFGAGPVPEEPAEIRAAPRPFVVGTVGVIARRKGSDIFVEAVERLGGSGDGAFEFQMIGAASDPLDRDWARGVLARAEAAGVKHFEQADVERAMRGWDAFVLPSRRDPFPLAMLEAMGLGLPVIGTRVDGIAEQISPGGGTLVSPEDSEQLASAIAGLAELPHEQRADMGATARARVGSEFSLEHLALGTESVYRRAMDRA